MTAAGVLSVVSNVTWVLVSLAALRLWWRRREPSTNWMVATFLVFDAIILYSAIVGDGEQHGLAVRITLVALLASPYPLYRFADTVVPARPVLRRIADGLLALVVVSTLALPSVPQAGDPWPAWFGAYVAVAMVAWLGYFGGAGWLLLRGARGQPGVVRNRLRMLAFAALLLGLLIPLSAAFGSGGTEDPNAWQHIMSDLLSASSAVLMLIAFAPPSFLRAAWRHDDERKLYEAAVAFMAAERPDDVARVLVPRLRALLGAPEVALFSPTGRVLARDQESRADDGVRGELTTRRLGSRRLEIRVAPTMPVFGTDEDELLDRLSVLAELAMDRTRLLQAEREAREDLERVNAELESFVYTTSHDLKNPVIALLGYLQVLREDHAAGLPDDARHYLDRMSANARHMEALIQDLLELSRVGRIDVEPERVETPALIDDVVGDLVRQYPSLTVRRNGLPNLWLNPTRARQLFANLIENAAKYAGRPDVTVEISARRNDGGWRITVRDDGRGIPDDYLDRVFGVFERLDADATSGTGMGLAICRRIVETAGGEIQALPSQDGAVFAIDLPGSAVTEAAVPAGGSQEA